MNTQGTSATLVQRVRTFADDVQRAKERGGMSFSTNTGSASAPVPQERIENNSASPTKQNSVPDATNQNPAKPSPARTDTPQPKADSPIQTHAPATTETQPLETSHLTDDQKPLDIRKEASSTSPESTIIKDTRRKQWALGKALGQSLTAWFDEQKNAIAQIADRQNPEPNVPPLDTRVSVIQAARQKSVLAPQDDHSIVVERLRTFARDAERVAGKSYTIVHKPTLNKIAPRWSSVSDEYPSTNATTPTIQNTKKEIPSAIKHARRTIRPPQPSLSILPSTTPLQPTKSLVKDVAPAAERSLPENAFVQRQEKSAPPHTKTTPTPYGMVDDIAPLATREYEEEMHVIEETDAMTLLDQNVTDARKAAIEQLLAVRTHLREKRASVTPSRDTVFTPPTFATTKTASFRTYRDDAIHDVEEHKRSIPNIAAAEIVRRTKRTPPGERQIAPAVSARPFVIASMIIIFIITISGFGFFWYAKQDVRKDMTTVNIPTFITIDAQKSVPFSTNRVALLQIFDTEMRASLAGITQIYPTYTENQSGETSAAAVSTSDFMHALDPRAPGSFIRNLNEEMMFGAYNGTDPFFILKTKQFDTAFVGMLDWEQYMSADLAPLFGSLVERTLDTSARTIDQTRSAYFVDDTVRNVDVRILYDDTGAERILYAFLNKNTIVLTASSAALIELIERLQ